MSAKGSDAELLRRFQAGEEAAFRELLERYGDVLARRIRSRLPKGLRRRLTVQDVLQDAALAAYRGRDRFSSEDAAAFRNWLLGIVDNKVKEAVRFHAGTLRRAVAREVTRSRRPHADAVGGRSPTPSVVAMEAERRAQVQRALESLPPDYREIIRLTREEQLTLRDAGERMGRSREAAKKLYARALAKLRDALDEEDPRA